MIEAMQFQAIYQCKDQRKSSCSHGHLPSVHIQSFTLSMDPITVFSLVGAVTNILDVLGKAICKINKLLSLWNIIEITFLSLISQLTTLKAALTNIQEWTESGTSGQHHQLTADLEGSLKCCHLVLDNITDHLSNLQLDSKGELSNKDKRRLILMNENLNGSQEVIAQQTNALTLLLTICNK